MFGDVFYSNGFNMVWICCAMEDEDRKNKTFVFTHIEQMPIKWVR